MACRVSGPLWVTLGVAVLALAACATAPRRGPMTPVSITDFESVAGQWKGLLHGMSADQQSDFVELEITTDGRYAFTSFRTIGVFSGSGSLELRDGTLVSESERGRATYTLYARNGERLLRVVAVLPAGGTLTAELTPAR